MAVAEVTRRPLVLVDVALAIVFVAGLSVAEAQIATEGGTAVSALRVAAFCVAAAAVGARRVRPHATFAVATLSAGVSTSLGGPPQVSVCVAVVAYTAASLCDHRSWWAPPALAATIVAAGTAIGRVESWLAALVAGAAIVCVGWFAGQAARERRSRQQAIAERQAERVRQHAAELRQAAIDERLVIARELHDVVAHAMSVIAVRAGVARVVMDHDPAEVREALGIVETTTRQALHEMRLLVSVLRDENAFDAALAPTPGIADLGELIERIRRAGVTVLVEQCGDQRPLPAGVDLSAYRIVQEALTNVVRHAGPTRAALRIEYLADEVRLAVSDEGPAADDGRSVPDPGTSPGHGLIGMGERVALFGGTLYTGRRGAGFEVRAVLPTNDEPALVSLPVPGSAASGSST